MTAPDPAAELVARLRTEHAAAITRAETAEAENVELRAVSDMRLGIISDIIGIGERRAAELDRAHRDLTIMFDEHKTLRERINELGRPTTEWGIQWPGENAQEHCGFSEASLRIRAAEQRPERGVVVERTAYRGAWHPTDDDERDWTPFDDEPESQWAARRGTELTRITEWQATYAGDWDLGYELVSREVVPVGDWVVTPPPAKVQLPDDDDGAAAGPGDTERPERDARDRGEDDDTTGPRRAPVSDGIRSVLVALLPSDATKDCASCTHPRDAHRITGACQWIAAFAGRCTCSTYKEPTEEGN